MPWMRSPSMAGMSGVLGAVESPTDRPRRRWAFDVAVALIAVAPGVPLLAAHDRPSVFGLAALTVMAALLVFRRIWPVAVFIGILVIAVGGSFWHVGLLFGFLDGHVVVAVAPLIALFTVAVLIRGRVPAIAAGVLGIATLGVIAGEVPGQWWYAAILVTGLVGGALALGLYVATQRAYLRELEDRAEQVERDRDRQVQLAAAAERARIAREMHDIVAHHLTVMVALSDGAVAAVDKAPDRAAEAMRSVSATGRAALTDARRVLGVLREGPGSGADPADQPLPGLADLDQLVERVRAARLPTELEISGATGHLPAGVQLTAYRLVQEALTNTLKHGGPGAHATVRLTSLPRELQIDVLDDGAGRHAPVPVGVGTGLVGMRERVHAFGGQVSAGPGRSGGWQVSARLSVDGALGSPADGSLDNPVNASTQTPVTK